MRSTPGVISSFGLVTLLTFGCADGGERQLASPLGVPTSPSAVSEGAGPPRSGSGTGLITSVQDLSSRNAGSNVIKERRVAGSIAGTLQGSFVEHVRGVIHDGRVTFEGTIEFTGSFADCGTGTVLLGVTGEGSAGLLPVTDSSVRVIKHASNSLSVAGVGTVDQDGPLLSYDIQYTCR